MKFLRLFRSTPRLCIFSLTVMLGSLAAQTASDPDNGQVIRFDSATNSYMLSWWARADRTYFLQHSLDLDAWTNLNVIEPGHDAIISYGYLVTGTALTNFFRISSVDIVVADPQNADFDQDGLSNQAEIAFGTDPLKADTDGDGVPDGAEHQLGTNATSKLANTPDSGNALQLKIHSARP